MRIHDANLNGLGSAELNRAQEAEALQRGGRGRVGGGAGEAGDRVQLSSLAGALRGEETLSAERQARIEQLSADVQAGRYRPDAAEVSRRLVDEALRERP